MSSIVFTAGPNSGRRYELDSDQSIIGRREDCQICIRDMRVSRQHARIHWGTPGCWILEDLGSNNGTFLNGAQVYQPTVLRDGDEIRVTVHRLRCELKPVDEYVPRTDSQLTVVDLVDPPRLYKSSIQDSAGYWRSGVHSVAGELRTAHLLQRKVAAMSTILELSHRAREPDEVMTILIDSVFDLFPSADAAGVLTRDRRSGDLRLVGHRSRATPAPNTELVVPRSIIAAVQNDGQGILLRERGGDAGSSGPRARLDSPVLDAPEGSRMGAPIRAPGREYGVVYVESSRDDFGQEDLDLLTHIASQIGLALHSLHIQRALDEKRRLERDLGMARQIQRLLLPAKQPDVSGLQFAVHYEPALEIGGDFYDFIWHDESHLAIVVGDVSGKAISAALYMARLTTELRLRAGIARSPGQVVARVNAEMLALGDDGMFATLFYAIYDLEERTLSFTNAGHVAPMIRRSGRIYPLDTPKAHVVPVGIVPGMEIAEAKIHMHPGDILVITTDGIHEARNAAGREYGGERLARQIRAARGGPEDIIGAVLRDVDSHVGDAQQSDDTTIVAMSIGRQRARRNTGVTNVPDPT